MRKPFLSMHAVILKQINFVFHFCEISVDTNSINNGSVLLFSDDHIFRPELKFGLILSSGNMVWFPKCSGGLVALSCLKINCFYCPSAQ